MQLLKINSNFSKDAQIEQDFTNIIYNLWSSSKDWESDLIWNIIKLWSKIVKEWKIGNDQLIEFLEFLKSKYLDDYFIANNNHNNRYIIAYVKALSINAYLNYMIEYTQNQLCDVLWKVHEDWKLLKINWHEILFIEHNWEKIICNLIGKFISSDESSTNRILVDTNIGFQLLLDNKNEIILKWTKVNCFWSNFYLVQNWNSSLVFDYNWICKFWWIQYKESINCNWDYYLVDYCKQNPWIFWLVNEHWNEVFGWKVRKNVISTFVHNWTKMLHWITIDWSKLLLPE